MQENGATNVGADRSGASRKARGTVPIRNISLRKRVAWRIRQSRRERRQQEEFRSTMRHGARCCRDGIPATAWENQPSSDLQRRCSVVKNANFSNENLKKRNRRGSRYNSNQIDGYSRL